MTDDLNLPEKLGMLDDEFRAVFGRLPLAAVQMQLAFLGIVSVGYEKID